MRFERSVADVFRITLRAYLLPLTNARRYVAGCLSVVWPAVSGAGVNTLLVVVLGLAALTIGTFAKLYVPPALLPAPEIYQTGLAEIHQKELLDGSSIHLAPDSQINVQFTSGRRDVALVRGEAFFDVKHDAKRPFQVAVGNALVRVLGTHFDVRALPNGEVAVTVRDGVVSVFRRQDGAGDNIPRNAVQLTSGQAAVVKPDGVSVQTLSTTAMDARLAWLNHTLVFRDQDLRSVVEELNRFSSRKIVIDDPVIVNWSIGGTFDVSRVDAVIDAFQAIGIHHRIVDHAGSQEIHLFSDRVRPGERRRDWPHGESYLAD